MKNFNSYMDSLSSNRDDKMAEFSGRLNEDRYNRQLLQQKVAFNLARVSPAASLSLATSYLAGTSLEIKNRFRDDTKLYQNIFSDFISEKTGMSMRGHIIIFSSTDDEEEKKAIDVREIPVFEPTKANMSDSVNRASVDMGLLAMFNLIFFAASFVAFGRYDAR